MVSCSCSLTHSRTTQLYRTWGDAHRPYGARWRSGLLQTMKRAASSSREAGCLFLQWEAGAAQMALFFFFVPFLQPLQLQPWQLLSISRKHPRGLSLFTSMLRGAQGQAETPHTVLRWVQSAASPGKEQASTASVRPLGEGKMK